MILLLIITTLLNFIPFADPSNDMVYINQVFNQSCKGIHISPIDNSIWTLCTPPHPTLQSDSSSTPPVTLLQFDMDAQMMFSALINETFTVVQSMTMHAEMGDLFLLMTITTSEPTLTRNPSNASTTVGQATITSTMNDSRTGAA